MDFSVLTLAPADEPRLIGVIPVLVGPLQALMAVLPAMKTPTVSQLYNGSGAAIEVIVEELTVREIIPSLIQAGASDIIEYPLNKVIP